MIIIKESKTTPYSCCSSCNGSGWSGGCDG